MYWYEILSFTIQVSKGPSLRGSRMECYAIRSAAVFVEIVNNKRTLKHHFESYASTQFRMLSPLNPSNICRQHMLLPEQRELAAATFQLLCPLIAAYPPHLKGFTWIIWMWFPRQPLCELLCASNNGKIMCNFFKSFQILSSLPLIVDMRSAYSNLVIRSSWSRLLKQYTGFSLSPTRCRQMPRIKCPCRNRWFWPKLTENPL